MWQMCDAETGCCGTLDGYTGRHSRQDTSVRLGEEVVNRLASYYFNQNRHLYFDRLFTSVPLLKHLRSKGTYACATVMSNRKGLPAEVKGEKLANRGDLLQMQQGSLMATVYRDKVSDFDAQYKPAPSPSPLTPDRPAPDGDDITSILGPGQVPPRPSSETLVRGDIKLGLAVSKGQLEVDIICVRGLQRAPSLHPPDTYVKTYLVEGEKTIQKKKSQVVKASTDPIFRRKIKYSACNVHGRHMRIVVWEKPRNFERKQSLGETVIRLDGLDLSAHIMTWYKLFPVNSTDLGSTDSLSQW
ncbi:hypothetical protein ACOMHN_000183 [Nucella lapillus]